VDRAADALHCGLLLVSPGVIFAAAHSSVTPGNLLDTLPKKRIYRLVTP